MYLGTRLQHPRDRLKKKMKKKKSTEITYLKTQPQHPRDRLKCKMRNYRKRKNEASKKHI